MTELASHQLKRSKRALRREVLARRDAISAGERSAWSDRIVERFLALPELEHVRVVMAFWSFGSEVETALLIERLHEDGRTVALPVIAEGEIRPVAYRPGDEVRPTSFGAMEPTGGRRLHPSSLDLVAVPGVAFDRSGGRLGYGGGFYDRLLGGSRPGPPAIGLAFSVQVVPGVPTGKADRGIDAVVTELEVIRCR